MRKVVSAALCLATVLTLGGCKKEPTPSPVTTPTEATAPAPSVQGQSEIPENILSAISKTTAQSSFHMTMSRKYFDEDGEAEDQYDLKVNNFNSTKITACGTVTGGDKTDSFSVDQGDYCLLQSDGALVTGQLGSQYTPCSALYYCNLLFSLLDSDVIAKAEVEIKSESDVTFLLSSEEFSKVWGAPDYSSVSLELLLSPDGYFSDAHLWLGRNGISDEYVFHFEDFGVTQEIAFINLPTVTEAQWKNAFSESAFENVTVLRYDDGVKDDPFITMITAGASAQTLLSETVDPNGEVTKIEGMQYHYRFGSGYFQMKTGKTILPDGSESPLYELVPTDTYQGITCKDFADRLNEQFPIAEEFEQFSFDEETQSYQATGVYEQWQSHTVITFNCGRITSIVHTLSDQDGQLYSVQTHAFQNYGTTTLEIPNVT